MLKTKNNKKTLSKMKKILTLALVLTTFAITAFADNTGAINQKALSAFNKSFTHAEEVSWELKSDLYKVTFKSGGKQMFAYYNHDGDQVAISRNLHIEQIPLTLAMELRASFADSWLTDLFEVSAKGETTYYATIESATHITIYKAAGTSGWAIFSKEKKK
jgi:hypothetical protein